MKPKHRHKARRLALQAIYQWQVAQTPLLDLEQQFVETNDPHKIDMGYFQQLVQGVVKNTSDVDQHIAEFSHRKIEQLDPIELAVLRLATYELQYQLDIPYRVVINEALELNKSFGTDDGHKFVNGILHKIAGGLRATEINSK